MNTTTSKYQLAVKNALTGWLTGQDMLSIIRYQISEFGELGDRDAATLMLYQATFN